MPQTPVQSSIPKQIQTPPKHQAKQETVYLKLVHFITKNALLATVLILIFLTAISASAAQLFAPTEFKPSNLFVNNQAQNNKTLQGSLVVDSESSSTNESAVSSQNSQISKSPYLRGGGEADGGNSSFQTSNSPSNLQPLTADENHEVVVLEECDLAVRYNKKLKYEKPFFSLDKMQSIRIDCKNSTLDDFEKEKVEKVKISDQNSLFYKIESVSQIPYFKQSLPDNLYLEKNQSGTGLGWASDAYTFWKNDRTTTISLQKALGNEPRNISQNLTNLFDQGWLEIQFTNSTSTVVKTETAQNVSTPNLLSGNLTPINEDLQLFSQESVEIRSNKKIKYFSAGKFTTGKYNGFERIVASVFDQNDSYWRSYLFITQNRQNFIFDLNSSIDILEALKSTFSSKITDFQNLDSDLTPTIDLYGNFALIWSYSKLEILDPNLDLTQYQSLESKDQRFKFFWNNNCVGKFSDGIKNSQFCGGKSQIVVQDSTGLLAKYNLTFDKSTANFVFNQSNNYPPNTALTKDQINSVASLYKTYQPLFPELFGSEAGDVVKNINLDELEKVASLDGADFKTDLFALKDKDHQFYQALYQMKKDQGVFRSNIPTLENYVAQNPVLFFKDRWDRLVAIAESENLNLRGGAKPVVYFYPKKETEVQFKFDTKMQLDVQIPRYDAQNGWKVRAKPNGELTDLQSNLTNCTDFEMPKFGQEYAKKACENNQYPYIYWAGASTIRSFPTQISSQGWVVKRESLKDFLQTKLSYIGLNDQEISDFLEYWLPKLESQNKPFYRLSFLQNAELDELFPMTISPKPDSTIRVFLDWEGLDKQTQIPAQNLIKYERRGFTAVEWGGLKK